MALAGIARVKRRATASSASRARYLAFLSGGTPALASRTRFATLQARRAGAFSYLQRLAKQMRRA
jgi:hypothetical protein